MPPKVVPAPRRFRHRLQYALAAAAAVLLAVCLLEAAALWQLGRTAREQLSQGNADLALKVDLARQENALLREDLAQAVHQLTSRSQREPSGARIQNALLAHGRMQEEVVKLVREVYVPQGEGSYHPGDLAALMDVVQGTTLFSSGQYEPAASAFRRAAQTFRDERFRLHSLFALGTSQKCAGLYEPSVQTYDTILRLTGGRTSRGARQSHHEMTSGPEAALVPTQGEKASYAHRAMAYHFKGWSLYCLAREKADGENRKDAARLLDEAERCYKRSLAVVPAYAKVRLNLWKLGTLRAQFLEAGGRGQLAEFSREKAGQELVRAETELKRWVAERPRDAKARFSLAMLYAWQEKKGLALAYLQEAVRIDGALASLVPSEHAFDMLASEEAYRAIVRRGGDYPAHLMMRSLFTDADFPPGPLERPGTGRAPYRGRSLPRTPRRTAPSSSGRR
jgi:tetratricopeptide (TPR) repeat protein